jgi:hypothetical protein
VRQLTAARRRLASYLPMEDIRRLMLMLDASGGPSDAPPPGRRRLRHDWVRGDVRCLMCGRLLGRLLGVARSGENGARSAGHPVAFIAYRPLDPVEPIIPFTPRLRFRCRVCGGAGALDDVDIFSTYDDTPMGADEVEEPRVRTRGRPRRRFPPQRLSGVDAAFEGF